MSGLDMSLLPFDISRDNDIQHGPSRHLDDNMNSVPEFLSRPLSKDISFKSEANFLNKKVDLEEIVSKSAQVKSDNKSLHTGGAVLLVSS
jgi:hypothetical protein